MFVERVRVAADWAMDRSVIPGYSRIGYALRGLEGRSPDPDGRLRGSTVLVTGANSGLGYATARQLAEHGARVVMLVRDMDSGREAQRQISERTGSEDLELVRCDLADLADVRDAASQLTERLDSLDAVVHNAGMITSGREQSADGYELTLAVHVLGPLLLTQELLPLLEAGAPSRVIFVTSGGMYFERLRPDDLQLADRDFDGTRFYAHAKRIQVVVGGILDQRLSDGISVHCMHPGWAGTPGVERSMPTFNKVLGPLLRNADAGADTTVWLCAADRPLREPGKLWMDREPRPEHRMSKTMTSQADRERAYAELVEMISGESPGALSRLE